MDDDLYQRSLPLGFWQPRYFVEPPYNDAQITAGQFDSQLKFFSASAAKYSGQIRHTTLGEEVNCDDTDQWGGAYKGNSVASTISAFPNVKIAFSETMTSSHGQPSATSYYPGNAYVDLIGIDGFSFPSAPKTWAQVFDSAITQFLSYGKPIWVLSEGSAQNKTQFVTDTFAGAKKYKLAGFMYFNANVGGDWKIDSAALATLKTLVP